MNKQVNERVSESVSQSTSKGLGGGAVEGIGWGEKSEKGEK